MASALPPVKGVAFSFETALVAQADTDIFKAGPTLAAGDCKVIKDGTYDDNIDTLPAAVSSCTNVITVALSATEMDADRVTVVLHDAAGDEWQDQVITIYTAAQTLNATDVIADDIKAIVGHADYGNAKLVRSSTPANALVVDAAGLADANAVKVGPTGAGTAQTAGDLAAAIAAVPTLAELEARTLVAADYFDPAVDKVLLGATQGAVEFGQVKILADTTTGGALWVENINVGGVGFYTRGGTYGHYSRGNTIAGARYSGPTYGQTNDGTTPVNPAAPSAADIKTAIEADGSKLDHLWEMTEDDGGVRRLTANALEEAPTGGSAPTAATIADAVWDELSTGHTGAGKAGEQLWTDIDAIKGRTDTIGALTVTLTAPVATSGNAITVIRGDDYLNADGRALAFTGTNWPVITAGTVALIVRFPTVTSYTGVVTGAAACYVELTDTQTALLTPGVYDYDLQVTLAGVGGSVITLAQGTFTVSADVR